jgi:hypothetical protein
MNGIEYRRQTAARSRGYSDGLPPSGRTTFALLAADTTAASREHAPSADIFFTQNERTYGTPGFKETGADANGSGEPLMSFRNLTHACPNFASGTISS